MTPDRALPPLILTYPELEAVVWPLVQFDAWGKDTIGDLWRMGAPTPQSIPNKPGEKRVVFPGQLMKWISDVLTRKGMPPDEAAKAYVKLFSNSSKFG